MFAIGDKEWAGLSKLVEEAGEVLQVCGKLMGSRGDTNHWSEDLRPKFVEELADLQAAIIFFVSKNLTDKEIEEYDARTEVKINTFVDWHGTNPALPKV